MLETNWSYEVEDEETSGNQAKQGAAVNTAPATKPSKPFLILQIEVQVYIKSF